MEDVGQSQFNLAGNFYIRDVSSVRTSRKLSVALLLNTLLVLSAAGGGIEMP
jgi:hypothetical protein